MGWGGSEWVPNTVKMRSSLNFFEFCSNFFEKFVFQICSSEKMCLWLYHQVNVINQLLASALTVVYHNAQPAQLSHCKRKSSHLRHFLAHARFYALKPQPIEKSQRVSSHLDHLDQLDQSKFLCMDVEKNGRRNLAKEKEKIFEKRPKKLYF